LLSTASVPGAAALAAATPHGQPGSAPEESDPIHRHIRFRHAKRATPGSSPNKLLRSLRWLRLLWLLLISIVWVGLSLAQQNDALGRVHAARERSALRMQRLDRSKVVRFAG
jgi:hypothetical protein